MLLPVIDNISTSTTELLLQLSKMRLLLHLPYIYTNNFKNKRLNVIISYPLDVTITDLKRKRKVHIIGISASKMNTKLTHRLWAGVMEMSCHEKFGWGLSWQEWLNLSAKNSWRKIILSEHLWKDSCIISTGKWEWNISSVSHGWKRAIFPYSG